MVSYAQNGEDVVLRRALGAPSGFYVDVGACEPTQDSVTRYFYDRGWSGINVEPQRHLYDKLVDERPRDVSVCCAIGTSSGSAWLVGFPGDDGLGTLDLEVAGQHDRFGKPSYRVQVQVRPLESVLEEHARRPIDFMKIDVEGREGDVLRSFDLDRWRPRALVVEATYPDTTRPTYDQWEALLTDAGYVRTLFDGLNCFYARATDHQGIEQLSAPANVFDQYVPYRFWRLMDDHARAALRRREVVPLQRGGPPAT
jgi:FkbM family methyltransferase